jgi:hypothetical protein
MKYVKSAAGKMIQFSQGSQIMLGVRIASVSKKHVKSGLVRMVKISVAAYSQQRFCSRFAPSKRNESKGSEHFSTRDEEYFSVQ